MLAKATEFTVPLTNKPGTLAQALEAIAKAGVNVDGVVGGAQGDYAEAHFVISKDAAKGRKALEDAGLKVRSEREVVLVDVVDKPGSGAAQLRKLADAGVNVEFVGGATKDRIVIGGADSQAIWKALGGAG